MDFLALPFPGHTWSLQVTFNVFFLVGSHGFPSPAISLSTWVELLVW